MLHHEFSSNLTPAAEKVKRIMSFIRERKKPFHVKKKLSLLNPITERTFTEMKGLQSDCVNPGEKEYLTLYK
jgi:hypothetical protein